jgi:cytidylate kinase
MNNSIITISREYGSGGRDVGRLLAEELGVPVFDDEIIHMATEESGLCADSMKKHDEKAQSRFIQNLKRLSVSVPSIRIPSSYYSLAKVHAITRINYKGTKEDQLFQAQAGIIKTIAETGGCVIVGRCAGYILRDNPKLISVFIRSKFEDRVQRTIETYNMPTENAMQNVKRVDKYRSNHYNFYTDQQWGASANYDLTINTSCSGIYGAVKVIKALVEAKTTCKQEVEKDV